MTNDLPDTLIEAVRYFADLDVCTAYMRKIKWPDGKITCPACGAHGERIGEIATRRMVAVAPFHLGRYVVEQVFRFNQRSGSDRSRFHEVMSRIVGKRLTWRELCAVDDCGFMGIT